MQISTKGRYGLRLMIELAAARSRGGTVQIETLVKSQEVSPAYVHNILNTLKKTGLVQAVRGPGGGYSLAKAPAKITAYQIIVALEGSLDPVPCLENAKSCQRTEKCVTRELWSELAANIRVTLESHTLADLARRQQEAMASTVISFDI